MNMDFEEKPPNGGGGNSAGGENAGVGGVVEESRDASAAAPGSSAERVGDFAGYREEGPEQPLAAAPTGPATVTIPAPAGIPAQAATRATARRSLLLARLTQAVWLGSGVFLLIATFSVFRALAPADAADAVGAMLTRWHYFAIVAPVILVLIEWHRARTKMVILLLFAIMAAALQGGIDLRIRAIRRSSPVPISSLDRSDPVRRRFGALHGLSTILVLAQIAAAAGTIAAEPDSDE